MSTSESVSFGSANSFRARPTIPPSVNLVNKPRQQVRTRVRRPPAPLASEAAVPLEEEGPPRFALDSDEAIQRFRESVSFGPQGQADQQQDNGGRLTFLSAANIRQQEPQVPRRSFESQQAPIKSFAAVPAVPPPAQDDGNTICCIFSNTTKYQKSGSLI